MRLYKGPLLSHSYCITRKEIRIRHIGCFYYSTTVTELLSLWNWRGIQFTTTKTVSSIDRLLNKRLICRSVADSESADLVWSIDYLQQHRGRRRADLSNVTHWISYCARLFSESRTFENGRTTCCFHLNSAKRCQSYNVDFLHRFDWFLSGFSERCEELWHTSGGMYNISPFLINFSY